MRILITGGTGLLGRALIETSINLNSIWAVYHGNYDMKNAAKILYFNTDICDKDSMGKIFLDSNPEIVIHTAGAANVDYCEKHPDEAGLSNVTGTEIIAELCKKHNSKIIFISTNAIFDGKNAPYSEDSAPSPINSYGKMKLRAEGIVRSSGLKYLIIRPILMYGWNYEHERSNIVTWLIEKLKNGEKVNIVNDVYENPLFNISCAEIAWALIGSNKEGIYHVAGRDVVSRYEFVGIIADVFDLDKNLINQVSSDFFPGLAPRPRNTSYNISKIKNELGMKILGLKENLILMKKTREKSHAGS